MKAKPIFVGDLVTIEYPLYFRSQFPHTAKMFEGKSGIVRGMDRNGPSALFQIALPGGNVTLVERKHIVLKVKARAMQTA